MAREWRLEGVGGASAGPMEEALIEVFGCVRLHGERRLIMLDPRGHRTQNHIPPRDNGMDTFSDTTGADAARR